MTAGTDRELAGRVALVTGSGRNLGRAIAIELAARGAAVAVNARQNRDEAESVVAELRSAGAAATAVIGDIGDWPTVERIVGEVRAALGPVSILVCNAGFRRQGSFFDTTQEEWDENVRVNLASPFYCVRAVADDMRRLAFGRLIGISGVVVHYPPRTAGGSYAHVAATKAGLEGLLRGLAPELAPFGITCNVVAPGPIDTGRPLQVPLPRAGRIASPEDIAYVCGTLCSPRAAFVTGQVVLADGGGPGER